MLPAATLVTGTALEVRMAEQGCRRGLADQADRLGCNGLQSLLGGVRSPPTAAVVLNSRRLSGSCHAAVRANAPLLPAALHAEQRAQAVWHLRPYCGLRL